MRKAGGNVVELGSILAFGFSPLWLLAAAADITRGTRVYLDALVSELKAAGVLAKEAEFASVDDLLGALEGASGTTARLIDIPPLELEGLKRSLSDLRDDAKGLPTPPELAAVYQGLVTEADREQRSLLEVSVGMGLAFFNSARKVGRQHVLDPYTEDLRPVRDEGFAAYARRVGGPYAQAVGRHFDPHSTTLTERGLGRLTRPKLLESEGMEHPNSFGARSTLDVGGTSREIFRLDALQASHDVRPTAVHAPRAPRERAAHGGRRERHLRRRRGGRRLGRERGARAGDLVHAETRAPAGLHRRPGGRRPRRDAQRDRRPRRRSEADQPAAARRARHRPLGAGRRVRDPTRDLPQRGARVRAEP